MLWDERLSHFFHPRAEKWKQSSTTSPLWKNTKLTWHLDRQAVDSSRRLMHCFLKCMKICKPHPLTTWRAKCYAKPCQGGAASAMLLVEQRHSPSDCQRPSPAHCSFFSQHVTGVVRGETHSHVTHSAAHHIISCFTISQLAANDPITAHTYTPYPLSVASH